MEFKDIGYIGLGNMGEPMAANLLKRGFRIHSVKHRRQISENLLKQGIIIEKKLAELADKCQLIFTNLPNSEDVEAVIFGDESSPGLIEKIASDSIIIDNSTISYQATLEISEKLSAKKVDFIDAPVSGGTVGAQNATLSIMVGATPVIFDKIFPVLQNIGNKITRLGNTGAGQLCKAANQIAIAGSLAAVAEALIFSQKHNLNPVIVREVLMGGAAYSKVLELQGERMVKQDFSPKFSNKLYDKDLKIALNNADQINISLPITKMVYELINTCNQKGYQELDTASIIKVISELSEKQN